MSAQGYAMSYPLLPESNFGYLSSCGANCATYRSKSVLLFGFSLGGNIDELLSFTKGSETCLD